MPSRHEKPIVASYRSVADFDQPNTVPGLTTGGLVSALSGIRECIWIGYAGGEYDWDFTDDHHEVEYRNGGSNILLHKMFLGKKTHEKFYEGICNGIVWPLLHVTPEMLRSETFPNIDKMEMTTECESSLKVYNYINRRFAGAIGLKLLDNPNSPVLVNDYHLCSVPSMLRDTEPDTRIVFFMHIPFPHIGLLSEAGRYISGKLIEGMIASDVVGFHTPEYVNNFQIASEQLLGNQVRIDDDTITYKGHVCKVVASPIGIVTEKIIDAAKPSNSIDNEEFARAVGEANGNGVPIITVLCRLDYTKGIPEAVDIIGELLRRRVKIKGIFAAKKSREGIPAYRHLSEVVREKVNGVNSKYRDFLGYDPIFYSDVGINYPDNISLMRDSLVNLVPPHRDGKNLVIPEAGLSKYHIPEGERGSIVAGWDCGVSHEISDFGKEDGFYRITPIDITGSADIIEKALRGEHNISDRLVSRFKDMDIKNWGIISELFSEKVL